MESEKAVIGCRHSDKLRDIPGGPSATDLPGMVHDKEPILLAFEKRKKKCILQRNRNTQTQRDDWQAIRLSI